MQKKTQIAGILTLVLTIMGGLLLLYHTHVWNEFILLASTPKMWAKSCLENNALGAASFCSTQDSLDSADPEISTIPVKKSGAVVYLTFDDGPSPYTDRLLDVLSKYNVKATFFVVNTPYIDKITRMEEEGHTVACHSAAHQYSQIYASDEAYFADLEELQRIIKKYTGHRAELIRFPGGSSNTVSRAYSKGIMTRLTKAVEAQGYQYFDWNVDSLDASGKGSSDSVYRQVISGIRKQHTSVVLQHDIHSFSVDAVEQIIQWGQKNGYTFLPLDRDSPSCHHKVVN